MESKTTIEQEVTFLLNSPRERNTEQGKLVCKKALEALTSIQSKTELYDLLRKINHAFLGIEAHGLLTPQEFGTEGDAGQFVKLLGLRGTRD